MKHMVIKYLAIIIAVLAYFFAAAEVAGAQSTKNLVQAEMVADTTAIQPGKPFTLGLHLHVADGWHVYWKNPGDAGGPTTFKISAPDGFAVSDVKYPVPKVLTLEGGLTEYVYEKELLLTATVTPPADLVSGKDGVTFTAAAGWCVCNPERCVLGKKTVTLHLPVAATAQPANSGLFSAWQARMPAEPDGLIDFSILSNQRGQDYIVVLWCGDPPASVFHWLPDASDEITVSPGPSTISCHRQVNIPVSMRLPDGTPVSAPSIPFTFQGAQPSDPEPSDPNASRPVISPAQAASPSLKMNTSIDPAFVIAAGVNPGVTFDGDNVPAVSTGNSSHNKDAAKASKLPSMISGILAYSKNGQDRGVVIKLDKPFEEIEYQYADPIPLNPTGGHP